jgi:uncharacterized membrane protein YcaP (DUF421 family)
MKRTKMETEQLRLMLRQQGIFSLKKVCYALLETTGTLSVIKYAEFAVPYTYRESKDTIHQIHPSVLVVDEGKIKQDSLTAHGLDEELIKDELKKQGYKNVSQVYYTEWVKDGGFYIKDYNDCI